MEELGRRPRSHAPDYFVRKVDGTGVVIDCRPVDRRGPRDVVAFDSTRRACEIVGWEYRLVGAPDPAVTANLRWLSGYRHPRYRVAEIAERLRAAFADPLMLIEGATAAGDRIAVLPVAPDMQEYRGAIWNSQRTANGSGNWPLPRTSTPLVLESCPVPVKMSHPDLADLQHQGRR